MVTEDRKTLGLFDRMTVAENITLRRLPELTIGPLVDPRAEKRAVAWSIKELAIKTAGGDVPVTSLSGGNQQKCILARWLLIEPKVLLLDEPTRGIDVGAKAEIYQLIRRLASRGPGDRHDLERAARAAGGLGPDHRALRRPARRRDSPRPSHRGGHHARRDVIPGPEPRPARSANYDLIRRYVEANRRQPCVMRSLVIADASVYLGSRSGAGRCGEFPRFQAQEIDPHAGEVCYAVTVADVNGDRKPDVVAVTEDAVDLVREPELAQARHHPEGDRSRQRLHPAARHRRRRPDRLRPGRRLATARHQEARARSSGWAATGRAAGRSTRSRSKSRRCTGCAGAT